ncbi:MAG TPA: cobalamin biosynthesis protein P47K, partial [Pirellulales bacterium]|nr:cobalamin biosynthesis protein P47K [Pirellulales bacterium]
GSSGPDQAMANLVSSDAHAELSLVSQVEVTSASLTVNARVAIDPEVLATTVARVAAELGRELAVEATIKNLQHFRPGRPVPTHRMTIGSTAT